MKTWKGILAGGVALLATSFEAPPASAHNWGCWRQPDRTVRTYNTASRRADANAAIGEWDSKTILSLPLMNSHTDISVLDGNYGNTGWGGLASIESSSGCTILHGHARLNLYYSWTSNAARGVFCQEVGHLFGLTHSNDGGCMGGGYFYSIGTYPHYTVVSHNVSDIQTKYSGTPAGPSEHNEREGQANAHASWLDRPATLKDAVGRASAVVVAQVARVADGPDIVVEVPGLEEGVDRIPTQRISFEVRKTLAGSVAGNFELFHTGNGDALVVDEDGPYEAGETYLLFITAREDGTYRLISPEGRLRATRRGLEPAAHGGYSAHMRGLSLADVSSDVAQILRGPQGR